LSETEILTAIRLNLAEVDRLSALLLQRRIEADPAPRCEICRSWSENFKVPEDSRCEYYGCFGPYDTCNRWRLREVTP